MKTSLQKILQYSFADTQLLDTAMIHKSYHEGSLEKSADNERLEFLGDSVLDLVISHYLYQRFPEMREGDLSKIKAHLVSTGILSRIGTRLRLGKFIMLGRGEEKNRGRHNKKIIASFLEALIGAIYLDGGFDAAYQRVIDFYRPLFSEMLRDRIRINDYKSELQEFLQKKGRPLPMYSIVRDRDASEGPQFSATVYIDHQNHGTGRGKNKREAEQKAAYAALMKLGMKDQLRKLSEVFLIKDE